MRLQVELPEKLGFLVTAKARYKVGRGGRGSGKSWSFARALLALGLKFKLRILCAREIQKSIEKSVYRLLSDQVSFMGLTSHYDVKKETIIGRNGTEFYFTGLSELTIDSIKSFEGCDICWVEEAHVVTKRSWDILIPTIRKDNIWGNDTGDAEIWISYNPELETDETHQRFTIHPPDDCINVLINWRDNPWWNDVLEKERLYCLKNDPDNYDNIWEGQCKPAVEGAIYFKQIQQMEQNNRICSVPYDPILKVHVVVDKGFFDTYAIGLVQKDPVSIRIIDYLCGTMRSTPEYSQDLEDKGYNWGKVWLPWDAYSPNPDTKLSTADTFRQLGWDVPIKEEINVMGVEEGIKTVRNLFPKMFIDKKRCATLIDNLKRYRRHKNQKTEAFGNPVHDEHSHGADMVRYLAVNAPLMTNMDNDTSGWRPTR